MEPQFDFIVSPSLLRQFDIQFAKSSILTTGLEFEDFVEYIDKPLQTLTPPTKNCIYPLKTFVLGVLRTFLENGTCLLTVVLFDFEFDFMQDLTLSFQALYI